jgi:anti-anti-sigma regulatory factor
MLWADQPDDGRIRLLGLEGSLSGTDLANLAGRLRGLAARGVFRVVVDLTRVDHWDFRGLRCLADAVEVRRRAGGLTAFICPNPYLRHIAAVAGVLDRLDVYDGLRLDEQLEHEPIAVGRRSLEIWKFPRASGE